MEAYFEAKRELFRTLAGSGKDAVAVINADDPWGQRLGREVDPESRRVTYGLAEGAAVWAEDLQPDATGTTFQLRSPWGEMPFRVNLLGRFNVYNALAAVAACGASGVDLEAMAEAFAGMRPIPGRLEKVGSKGGVSVFVDYAHTDDALRNALEALRAAQPGRIVVVFGCGGDRDTSKRPLMGAAAREGADLAVITNDNPRTEDPERIVSDIVVGFGDGGRFEIVYDREQAIARALSLAGEGDVVLVAGKGHENVQVLGDTVVPFDDREVVRRLVGGNSG
jgi:UDP-N-acetylmuramoyl-L-alanyl-D-glutamate--2,6-diaminopimelate ligase